MALKVKLKIDEIKAASRIISDNIPGCLKIVFIKMMNKAMLKQCTHKNRALF